MSKRKNQKEKISMANKWGFKVKKIVYCKEKKNKKAKENEMNGKIADQLERNKSEAFKCLFDKDRQNKKNNIKILLECHAFVLKKEI